MKTKPMFLLAAASLALLAAPLSAAPVTEGQIRKEVVKKLVALRDNLGLTAEQKKAIRAVLQSYKGELKDQWADGKAARQAMAKAVKTHGSGSPEAAAAAAALGDVAAARALLLAEIAEAIRPILTPEQIEILEAAREKFLQWIEDEILAAGY